MELDTAVIALIRDEHIIERSVLRSCRDLRLLASADTYHNPTVWAKFLRIGGKGARG